MFETENYFELKHFLNETEVLDLREQVNFFRSRFKDATIGSTKIRETKIRSDQICWIDPEMIAISTPLQNYVKKLEVLKKSLNEKFYFGLRGMDSHFAIYAPGAFYSRHLDKSASSARKISLVCYLNQDWKVPDGGVLRLYLEPGRTTDIAPEGGTLVGFLSDHVEHEVLTSNNERMSLTTWFLGEA